jgi:hypothetical protein
VSPAAKAIRKSPVGSPFITFTAKALPRVAEAALKNPLSVAKYKMLFDSIERVGLEPGVIKKKDLEIIKRNSRGSVVALPFKDKDGNNVTLDLSYILPWGDIGETGGMFGLPSALSPSGPLKSIADVGFNKSPFRGQEIFNKETDTAKEKAAKISDYLLKAALPSFMPGVNVEGSPFKGGYSFNRLMAAMQGTPYPRESPRGTVPSKKSAIAHTVFGLKTSSVNPAQMLADEILGKQRETQDLERNLSRKLRAKGLSEAEKARQIKSFQKKVKRLWKEK